MKSVNGTTISGGRDGLRSLTPATLRNTAPLAMPSVQHHGRMIDLIRVDRSIGSPRGLLGVEEGLAGLPVPAFSSSLPLGATLLGVVLLAGGTIADERDTLGWYE